MNIDIKEILSKAIIFVTPTSKQNIDYYRVNDGVCLFEYDNGFDEYVFKLTKEQSSYSDYLDDDLKVVPAPYPRKHVYMLQETSNGDYHLLKKVSIEVYMYKKNINSNMVYFCYLSEFLKSPDATHSKIYPEEALMQWRKLK
jgi:hypothetical protein